MSVLVSPLDLAADLERGSADRPVVLDVRWRLGGPPGRADHAAGHVPGAVFVDLDTELAAPPGTGGRHPLPEPSRLEEVLRRAGISEGSRVVAYDHADGSVAARAWWLLRWAGLSADHVAVLDGGWAAWREEGLPVSTEEPAPEPGDVVVRPGGMPVLDADGAAALARSGVLLDARAGERYRGEAEPVDPRAGHIPGARSAPSAGNAGHDGRWQEPEDLAERFRELGVEPGSGPEAVGAYCGSGVTASSLVLALEHAGLTAPEKPAALYAGSWSDWSTDPDRPAATGPEAG
ncbi:MAG: 3-mercaptopyruvate sulfurtransferase [Pseudonocardia sp.]|uniref:sulfurtransferase n=1 Tax=Pseudonocardia sp. TaxID=60912 RepID=UPI0026336A17|nr:sulfurtransferase [Pseudonocardia sp.]MCU1630137.1 3-mercaptopyruvate sulfurtransferase [Pseudonocardia sp.]